MFVLAGAKGAEFSKKRTLGEYASP